MSGRLEGRRALVTGAASGIGAGVVERFREEGADVLGSDLAGADLILDVRDRGQTEAAVAETVARLGGLDVVVCNAGRPAVGPLHELDEDVWDDALATNLKSVYLMARAAWPHLVASRGTILATGSVVGLWGSQNQAAYCASKAGVGMLVRCLALDGAAAGIRANCVCPGFTETPLLERFLAEQDDPEACGRRSAPAIRWAASGSRATSPTPSSTSPATTRRGSPASPCPSTAGSPAASGDRRAIPRLGGREGGICTLRPPPVPGSTPRAADRRSNACRWGRCAGAVRSPKRRATTFPRSPIRGVDRPGGGPLSG